MALTTINAAGIAADAIDETKIADDGIDSEHYNDGSIDHVHLAADAVDGDNIADDSIGAEHIADNAVGLAAMAGLARGKIIYGNASGDPTALTVGSANQVLTSDGTDVAWAAASGGSGPAFRATINASTNQGLAGDTAATVEFDEETFDTASCFDTSTHKFTPNKAGYYQVNYHVGFSASNNATSAWVYLQKNDAAYSQISQSNDWCYHMDMTSSDLVYLNGSSDSIRLRALHNSSGDTFTLFDGTTDGCYFSAVWIRS